MATTWKIESLEVRPQDGTLTNVVITAHWRCNAEQDGKVASSYGTCSFQQPGEPFVPYEKLTEEQILQWCYDSGLGKEGVEASVQQQLETLIAPPTVMMPLPWAPSEK